MTMPLSSAERTGHHCTPRDKSRGTLEPFGGPVTLSVAVTARLHAALAAGRAALADLSARGFTGQAVEIAWDVESSGVEIVDDGERVLMAGDDDGEDVVLGVRLGEYAGVYLVAKTPDETDNTREAATYTTLLVFPHGFALAGDGKYSGVRYQTNTVDREDFEAAFAQAAD